MGLFKGNKPYTDTDKFIWILLFGAFILFIVPLVGFNKHVIYPIKNQHHYQSDVFLIDSAWTHGSGQGKKVSYLYGRLADRCYQIDGFSLSEPFWYLEVNDSLPVWYNAGEKVVGCGIYPNIGLVLRNQDAFDISYYYRKLAEYTIYVILFPVGSFFYIRYRIKLNKL